MFLKLFAVICILKLTFADITYNDLPVDKGDAPLVIDTLITLEKISSFNLKELEYSLIYFQEQFWKIKRDKCDYFYLNSLKDYLNVNVTAGKRASRKYNINLFHISKLNIWVPNSFQIDSKQISRIPLQNELIELSIEEDYCHFNLRTRLNVKVGCQMYFKNYPNDLQICPFRLVSYTYPLESVVYRWKEPGIITNRLVKQINQYTLSLSKFQYNSTKYDDKVKFSFLEISFRFENHISHFMFQVVLPSYFIISIVYLNFWMKPDGSPGRFLLTILTFISLSTIYTSNRDKLPALSYANAVDCWMLANLFFVFIAICELVFNSFRIKRRTKKEEAKKKKQVRTPSSEIYIITPSHEDNHLTTTTTAGLDTKPRNDNMTNFMYGNGYNLQNDQNDLHKSHENVNSEVITVSSSNNLLTLGKETPLHSTIHSSIENVLQNHIRKRYSTVEINEEEKKKHTINLDSLCRLWYPILYLLFNIVYWISLLNRWFDASIFKTEDELMR